MTCWSPSSEPSAWAWAAQKHHRVSDLRQGLLRASGSSDPEPLLCNSCTGGPGAGPRLICWIELPEQPPGSKWQLEEQLALLAEHPRALRIHPPLDLSFLSAGEGQGVRASGPQLLEQRSLSRQCRLFKVLPRRWAMVLRACRLQRHCHVHDHPAPQLQRQTGEWWTKSG